MPSKLRAASLGAAALIALLTGCATPPAKPAPAATTAPAPTPAPAAADKGQNPTPADAAVFAAEVKLGDDAYQLQDFDHAIYHYIKALDKTPNDATTLAKIGAIEDARGNPALAEKAFTLAHAADPVDPRIAERLARLDLRSGKIDGAAELYTAVLARDDTRTRALDGMGEVSMARAQYDEAVHYFDKALAGEKPDRAAVLTNRGYAKAKLNDLAGAEADFRAALAVEPRDDTWRYLGDLLAARGEYANAFETLLHLMDTAQAYNEIGVVLMNAKKFQDARDYFAKAIKASPSWFEEAQKNLAVADEHLRHTAG